MTSILMPTLPDLHRSDAFAEDPTLAAAVASERARGENICDSRRFRVSLEVEGLPQNPRPTIEAVLESFLTDQRKRLAASTISSYESVVGLLRSYLNGYAYQGLSRADDLRREILDFLVSRGARVRRNRITGSPPPDRRLEAGDASLGGSRSRERSRLLHVVPSPS